MRPRCWCFNVFGNRDRLAIAQPQAHSSATPYAEVAGSLLHTWKRTFTPNKCFNSRYQTSACPKHHFATTAPGLRKPSSKPTRERKDRYWQIPAARPKHNFALLRASATPGMHEPTSKPNVCPIKDRYRQVPASHTKHIPITNMRLKKGYLADRSVLCKLLRISQHSSITRPPWLDFKDCTPFCKSGSCSYVIHTIEMQSECVMHYLTGQSSIWSEQSNDFTSFQFSSVQFSWTM